MSDPLAWLLVLEFMGLLGVPLSFLLFSRLPDRGYSLAKILTMLLSAYFLWIVGLTGLLPSSVPTIAGILGIGAVLFAWLYYRFWPELECYVRCNWRYILIVEGLFLVVFLAWALIISEAPGINHTEKPMDFAFLTSILQSSSYPPEDPWLSGHSISYYYFGHFIMALPMKIAGITSNVGYNLALASIPALLAVASFGLTYNLVRLSGGGFRSGVLFGLLAPLFIVFIGNLEGTMEFIQLRGWGGDEFWRWVGIKGMEGQASGGFFPDSNWWWWRATRVIDTLEGGASLDYTITEFPFFSFLLGDLHSHVLNLPFTVFALALALNLSLSCDSLGFRWLIRNPWEWAILAVSAGSLAFINSWDFPIYAGILGAVVLAKTNGRQMSSDQVGSQLSIDAGLRALGRSLLSTALFMGPLLAAAVLLFLPFYLTLSSQVSGILPHLGSGTRPLHFLLVVGLPVLLALGLLWRQFFTFTRPDLKEAPAIVLAITFATAPLLLWLLLASAWGVLTQDVESLPAILGLRTLTVLPALAVAGLAGYSALSRSIRGRGNYLVFPLLLLAAATYLLAGAELFHLADFFGNRMNTIFKVYYQAWLLLGIVGSFSAFYCWTRFRQLAITSKVIQVGWGSVVAVLLVFSLYYPIGAILDRTSLFSEGHDFKQNTLDGLAYLRSTNPGEYAAIKWLRNEAEPGRMVEADGDDYTEYNRVSAATGRATVLGWKGHEHQWRGSTEAFRGRPEHIAQIYQSPAPMVVLRLLAAYDVRYVYVGHRERAKYGVSEPQVRDEILEIVFERDDVSIYESILYSPLNE